MSEPEERLRTNERPEGVEHTGTLRKGNGNNHMAAQPVSTLTVAEGEWIGVQLVLPARLSTGCRGVQGICGGRDTNTLRLELRDGFRDGGLDDGLKCFQRYRA